MTPTSSSKRVRTQWRTAPPDRANPLKVWPLRWRHATWFVAAFITMTAIWVAVGFTVTEIVEPALGSTEADLSEWLEENRTGTWNDVAEIASIPSDTPVKIGIVALLLVVFPAAFRRWHDWAFLASALVLEVSVYGLSSWIVGRPRPPVERLADAPTQSWPSGHVAAAVTFYVGLAVVAQWRTDDRRITISTKLAAGVVVVAMMLSRLYLGMHYVTDLFGGVALGVASLFVADWIMHRAVTELDAADDNNHLPSDVTSMDVSDS